MKRHGFRMHSVAVAIVASALMITSACTAEAAPPGFPNVDSYTPVDPNTLMHMDKSWRSVVFYPASKHYSCSYLFSGVGIAEDNRTLSCQGDIPGAADAPIDGPDKTGCSFVGVAPNWLARRPSQCGVYTSSDTALPGHELLPGQKVTYGSMTCVQDQGDRTACIDGDHGFVISPEKTWAF
ncbi:hypothetical protein KIH27_16450 [Mycobacterium sp. M1]|uniref:Secreted protein n=1 Tax=Mycolicibacter acidiphilus TaxID=2835306 RepID=A0ABS5RNN0_9MYCO|nr:hypothetical protein [Mycolicibacter acidiphilus]MBS9535179.1 hypothetical protein [Mycolicibacter acidiphilus]